MTKAIARAVYRDLLARHHWKFEPAPREEVLAALSEVAPRMMRKMLIDAMGTAKLAERDHVEAGDLALIPRHKERRIGF